MHRLTLRWFGCGAQLQWSVAGLPVAETVAAQVSEDAVVCVNGTSDLRPGAPLVPPPPPLPLAVYSAAAVLSQAPWMRGTEAAGKEECDAAFPGAGWVRVWWEGVSSLGDTGCK